MNAQNTITALKWVQRHSEASLMPQAFDEVSARIISCVWENIDDINVLQAFAETVAVLLQSEKVIHNRKFHIGTLPGSNEDKRRVLLTHLIPMLVSGDRSQTWQLGSHGASLVSTQDLPWILNRLCDDFNQESQLKWLELVSMTFDRSSVEHHDALCRAIQVNVLLAKTYGSYLAPVELGSPAAENMKAEYYEYEYQQPEQKPLVEPPPQERIKIELCKFEAGDLDAWWRLNMEMTLKLDSTHYGNEYQPDLTELPGWEMAIHQTKMRIVAAAHKYILEQEPQPAKWLGKNILYRPDFAAYRAIHLLKKETDVVASLPPSVWQKWAFIALAYPTSGDTDKEQNDIIRIAYGYASKELLTTLDILIDQENANDNLTIPFILRRLESCWDEQLASSMLSKVKSRLLKPTFVGCILNELIARNFCGAHEYATSLILLTLPTNETLRMVSVVATSALLNYAADAGWLSVWPAIQQDITFGCEVITSIAIRADRPAEITPGLHWTDDQVADIYLWIHYRTLFLSFNNGIGCHYLSLVCRHSIRGRFRANLVDLEPNFSPIPAEFSPSRASTAFSPLASTRESIAKSVRNELMTASI